MRLELRLGEELGVGHNYGQLLSVLTQIIMIIIDSCDGFYHDVSVGDHQNNF